MKKKDVNIDLLTILIIKTLNSYIYIYVFIYLIYSAPNVKRMFGIFGKPIKKWMYL